MSNGKCISLFLLICMFLFSACSILDDKIDVRLYEENDFISELILKYRQYALVSKEKYRNDDYKFFNKKSKKIAKLTDDEILSTKNNKKIVFSEKEKFEIYNYKNRLFSLVNNNSLKTEYPIKTANLFFFLDCWNYYAFITNDRKQSLYCRQNFIDIFLPTEREFLKENNIFYKNKEVEVVLTKEEKDFFEKFNNDNSINIYFDLDSYKLNGEAIKEIKSLLKYLANLNEQYLVIITGHTDRSGKVIYNNNLALKRANSVYNILIKNGVPKEIIKISGFGSKEPAVITKEKAVNKLNRRVEIRLQKNHNVEQNYLPQPL